MKNTLVIIFVLLVLGVANASSTPSVVFTAGHTTQINAMVVSENEKFLASAGNNKLIKIWDIASGKEFRTITQGDGRVGFLSFKNDSKTLIGISSENELIGWDIISGDKLFETPAQGSLNVSAYFIPGTDLIIYIDDSGKLCRYNSLEKKKTILNETMYCTSLNINAKKGRIYINNHLKELVEVDLATGSILKRIQTNSKSDVTNNLIPPQLSINGRYLISNLTNNAIRIIDIDNDKVVFEKNIFKQYIHSLLADPKKSIIYIGVSGVGVVAYDYQKQRIISEIPKQDERMFDYNGLAVFPSKSVLLTSNFNLIQFYDLKSQSFFKKLEPRIKSIIDMSYDQNDKYLAISRARGTVEVWDLSQNKVAHEVKGMFPCSFSPDGSKLVVMNTSLDFIEYDTKSWEITGTYQSNSKLNSLITFTDDGKYIATGGYMPNIDIYSTISKKKVHLVKHPMGINSLDFHPTKPLLAFSNLMGGLKIVDFKTNEEKFDHTLSPSTIGGIKFSPDGRHLGLVTWNKQIMLFDANSFKLIKEWRGHSGNINGLDFNQSGDVLMTYATNIGVYEADNSVIFWKLDGQKIVKIDAHKSGVNRAFFDKKTDYVFSASDDGSIMINSYKEKKVLATLIATDKKEFIIYTYNNYYMAAKEALSSIAFRIGENLVPFEQFDINLNRPDIVGKIIGKTPENLLDAYHYLYRKRLRKYNLDEENIKLDFNLPNTVIENAIPLSTEKETVEISIKTWDVKYPIKQINLYVNNTPVYGVEGIRPKNGENPLSFRYVANVVLLDGINKIDISCINSNGTESLYATKQIVKTGETKKADFYIASIGVSKYKNEAFNLTYPTKDATEIAEALQEGNKHYETVHVKYLLDEQVTVENIRLLTQFFKSCKPGDVVAIFIAGHGLLDENFDYYFGTYNIDFNHPAVNGLPYSEITKLLDAIKSYKKLLIMDTCHSGELDKEEVKKSVEVEVESGDIQFRSAGSAISVENAFGEENMRKLSSDLFSDTRKGSGATVISSAGGAEYAIESDEWQNGLFTYNFIRGFKELKADANGDGVVQISEIRKYVNEQVSKMSNSKQRPTAREENIAVDIVIF